jgi:hypothetical protein
VETSANGERCLRELPYVLGLNASEEPSDIPNIPSDGDATRSFLVKFALQDFLDRISFDRQKDLDLIERHVKLCFGELIDKRNEILGKHLLAKDRGDSTADGLIEIESQKLIELQRRREIRLEEIKHQRDLSLQDIKRIGSALVLPHPARVSQEASRIIYDPETERIAMETVITYEENRGCHVEDRHKENLGYDVWSLNPETGELRLIEVKGIGNASGTVFFTPNEKRVADDRRDIYWLYVVTDCRSSPTLQEPITDPAKLNWHEVTKIDHYWLNVDAIKQPMILREDSMKYER